MAVQAQFSPDSFGFDTDSYCFDFQQNVFLHQPPIYGLQHCNRETDASSSSYNSSMSQFLNVHHHLEMQREELDCFLRSQAEGLKCALREQTRQQLAVMLKKMECEATYAMKRKEEELIQARNRSIELEVCIRKAQRESESWQVMARENEATATNLSKKLEQLRESLVINGDKRQDSESICCGSCQRNDEEEEEEERVKKIVCKGCKCRGSCIVFLPCRHLCSCKFCEAFFVSCPVCESFKEGSIEVFWD